MAAFFQRLFGGARMAAPSGQNTKDSSTAFLALHSLGEAQWTARNQVALTRQGYERNPIVYRAVRLIVEAAASIPWVLREGRVELIDHPFIDLMARPNPYDVGTGLLETLYTNLLLFGNAYLEAVLVDGSLRELYALRPDRMTIVLGQNGWPVAYDYNITGNRLRYAVMQDGVQPILHLKLVHPLDDHYGFAPLAAAQMPLDIHNAASTWNKALLDNAARPSGALVYAARDGSHLSQEQFERLKSELDESFQGARNAGRPLLLEGGLDWKALSLTPKDMDFMEAKAAAAREIALAFGIPPLVLGLPGDNTFSNYQEANRVFWRQTIIPLVNRTQKHFSAWLAPLYPELSFDYDLDRIEALAAERESEWRRIGTADFLTQDEKREAVGYGITKNNAREVPR
jgi:HK97 family phage portal protein